MQVEQFACTILFAHIKKIGSIIVYRGVLQLAAYILPHANTAFFNIKSGENAKQRVPIDDILKEVEAMSTKE